MKKKNYKYFVSKNFNVLTGLLFLFLFQDIAAQELQKLGIILNFKVIEGDMKNSLITITKKGAPFKVIDPNSENLNVELPLETEYIFTFAKIGYVTKSLMVDTHVPDGRGTTGFQKKIANVELEKQPDGRVIKNSKPFARIAYSIQREDFSFDKDFADKAEKSNKKEIASLNPKEKTDSPALIKTKPESAIVKQIEKTPETTPQKVVVRTKEVKVVQEDNKKITTIIVTIDEMKYVYRKEEYSFNTFYYKDNISITSDTYENETK